LDDPSPSINAGRADDESGSPAARRGRPREHTSKEKGVPMSAVNLDDKPALVRVDLQKGILGRPTAVPTDEIERLGMRLAAAFPADGLPVVRVKLAWLGEIATTDKVVAALAA
jgi:hypothetical protein